MPTMTNDDDVRRRARAVTEHSSAPQPMSAHHAARCMLGIINIMVEIYGAEATRLACADLVRCDASWDTRFRELPRDTNAQTLEITRFLAHASRGILLAAGPDHLRSALSFWATERDAAVLQRIASGASA